MKKVFRLAALAVLVLGLTTACKQKVAEPEEIIDTTPIEEVIDTVIEEVAEEVEEVVVEPVKKATKKAAKKATDASVKTTDKDAMIKNQMVGAEGSDARRDMKKAEKQQIAESQKIVNNSDTKKK